MVLISSGSLISSGAYLKLFGSVLLRRRADLGRKLLVVKVPTHDLHTAQLVIPNGDISPDEYGKRWTSLPYLVWIQSGPCLCSRAGDYLRNWPSASCGPDQQAQIARPLYPRALPPSAYCLASSQNDMASPPPRKRPRHSPPSKPEAESAAAPVQSRSFDRPRTVYFRYRPDNGPHRWGPEEAFRELVRRW